MGRRRNEQTPSPAEEVEQESAAVMKTQAPDPEVLERPTRRVFTAEYKRRILRKADACTQPGEVGALLRREGLYSSHLSSWRQARERGEVSGLSPRKRGPKQKPQMVSAQEYARVKRDKERLERELEKAHAIIDVQKKLSVILGIDLDASGKNK